MIWPLYVLLVSNFFFPPASASTTVSVGIPAFAPDGRMAVALDGDIWIAEFRGKDRTRIRWTQCTSGPADDRDPVWSADGQTIIYASNRRGPFDLWRTTVAHPDAEPALLIRSDSADTQPSVSAAGDLVWVRGLGPDADLWIRRPGQEPVQLTRKPGAEHSPALAPNGSAVAYIAESGHGSQLRLLQLGGKDRLLTGDRNPEFPAWSPDGRRLVYTTRGRDAGVWITPIDGAYHNLVSSRPAAAVWQPGGRELALLTLDGPSPAYNGDPDWAGDRFLEGKSSSLEKLHFLPAPTPPDAGETDIDLPAQAGTPEKSAERFDRIVDRLEVRYTPTGPEWAELVRTYREKVVKATEKEEQEQLIYEFLRKRPLLRKERQGRAGVSSAHPLASAAGVEIMKKGGNVVDAAIAVSFVIGVVEPDASGLGGYGEMLIYLQGMEAPTCIEFLTRVPEAASLTNGRLNPLPRGGPVLVNVPGTVAGMELAWKRYGSGKVAWADLVAPAIRLAEEGFLLDDAFPTTLTKEKTNFLRYAGSRSLFFRDSIPLQPGDTLRNPDLAWTLRQIAEGGAEAFYRGEIARRLVRDLNSRGNVMTLQDMARYYAVERTPVATTYRGHTVFAGPPPVSGGANLIGQLNHFEQYEGAKAYYEDAATLHAMIEAWKLAPSGWGRIADPGLWPVDLTPFTDKQAAAERWQTCFDPVAPSLPEISCVDERTSAAWGADGVLDARSSTGTTAFAVADADGNMVSVTQTLGTWGGNFYVTPGLGFLYNDKLGSYGADPNSFNARIPFARNVTGIMPTMVFKGTADKRRPLLAVGAAGNAWINAAVYQIVAGVIDGGLGPQRAIEQPRFLVGARRDPRDRSKVLEVIIQAEDGFAPGVLEHLREMGHQVQVISRRGELRMGYAAVVLVEEGQVRAGGDPRRSGQGWVMENEGMKE